MAKPMLRLGRQKYSHQMQRDVGQYPVTNLTVSN